MKKNRIAKSLLGLCVAGVMSVGADVVMQYSFPASYNGTGTTITDLSTAGNDATLEASNYPLTDDRPAGFAATQMSWGGNSGGADMNSPITTATVAANDGFVFDVWFKTADTAGSKLLSNGGYDDLKTGGGNITFGIDNNNSISYAVNIGQWYHAVAQFDTTGNSLDAGNDIAGVARLYIDGTLVGTANRTMRDRDPDGTSRGFGINVHPVTFNGEANTGIIFNPSVELIPEPATLGMIAMFGGGLLFIRRKMMM